LAAITLAVNAQLNATDAIEPADFNVTNALLDLGVDVYQLPAGELVSRSSNLGCSIAVS
jgi:hypothetical protein